MGEGEQLPYRVEESDEAGRFLVASRDIQKGEVVLSDLPLVAGPIYTRTRPVCLECLRFLEEGTSEKCIGCGLPLCGPQCQGGPWHRSECQVFKEAGMKEEIDDFAECHPLYSCITPLRMLLLKRFSPSAFAVIDTFMDHDSDRQKVDSPAWKIHELLVVNLVRETLKLDQFTQKDVRRAIGILRTNSVKLEARPNRGDGIAVYPNYTYANHSCVCNTHTRKHKDDHRLELIAQSPIMEGEQIWTRYTTPQLGSYQRVADLKKTWHFTCTCPRCEDPTELGSMMSAVRCSSCSPTKSATNPNNNSTNTNSSSNNVPSNNSSSTSCPGFLLPRAPTLVGGPWTCNTCKRTLGASAVQGVIRDVLESIKTGRQAGNSTILNLVSELGQTSLHPNHYLLLGLKEIVIQRLMCVVRQGEVHGEKLIDALQLRSQVFNEVAEVLEVVDSKGAGWLEKAAKMEEEAKARISEIKRENVL